MSTHLELSFDHAGKFARYFHCVNLGKNREDDDATDNYRAIQETVHSIVSLTAKASATPGGMSETVAAAVVSVTCSIAARSPDFAVGSSNEVQCRPC